MKKFLIFAIIAFFSSVFLFIKCEFGSKQEDNITQPLTTNRHTTVPSLKKKLFVQEIKITDIHKNIEADHSVKITCSINYSLNTTKYGTVRLILLDKNNAPLSQHYKIVEQGSGIVNLSMNYNDKKDKPKLLTAILFRDEQEVSGTIDKVFF